jgi:hypothetical protein
LFWLLIVVFSDLFRRHDVSGWVKAIWVIGLIVFPYLGVLAYLITQGGGMAERSNQQAQQAREELRSVVGFSRGIRPENADCWPESVHGWSNRAPFKKTGSFFGVPAGSISPADIFPERRLHRPTIAAETHMSPR